MQLTETEKTMIHMQEVGLQLNETKNAGVKTVSIDTYNNLLESYIELLRFVDKVSGRIKVK